MEEQKEILLQEYEQGGQHIRMIERLALIGLNVTIVLWATLAAVAFHSDNKGNTTLHIVFAILAAIGGLFLLSTTKTHQLYVRTYFKRMRQIEDLLGMNLFKEGKKASDRRVIRIRNKDVIQLLGVIGMAASLIYVMYLFLHQQAAC